MVSLCNVRNTAYFLVLFHSNWNHREALHVEKGNPSRREGCFPVDPQNGLRLAFSGPIFIPEPVTMIRVEETEFILNGQDWTSAARG